MIVVRYLLVTILVLLIALGLGALELHRGTSDTRWINIPTSRAMTVVRAVDVGAPIERDLETALSASSNMLDAPSDAGATGDEDLVRSEVSKKGLEWISCSLIASAIVSFLWLLYSHSVLSSIGGPQGIAPAKIAWGAALIVVISTALAIDWFAFSQLELGGGRTLSGEGFTHFAVVFGILDFALFWFATGFGALPEVKACVPLAGRISGWRARSR